MIQSFVSASHFKLWQAKNSLCTSLSPLASLPIHSCKPSMWPLVVTPYDPHPSLCFLFICPRMSTVTVSFWMTWDGTSSNAIGAPRWTRRERIHWWIWSFHLMYVHYSTLFIANISLALEKLGQCQETKKPNLSMCNKPCSHKMVTWLFWEGEGQIGGWTQPLCEIHPQELTVLNGQVHKALGHNSRDGEDMGLSPVKLLHFPHWRYH